MASSTQGDLVNVDPDGDLILKVGSGSGNEEDWNISDDSSEATGEKDASGSAPTFLCIRVSSKILTMCSPVFKAMLHGSFSEGQLPLSATNPPTLDLPADDPDAMSELCKIIHHKWDIDLASFLLCICEVATVADKYACSTVVKSWFHHHLLRNSPRWSPQFGLDLAHLITTSYLLDNVEAFYYFTLTAVKALDPEKENKKGKRTKENKVFKSVCNERMPQRVVDLIEKLCRSFEEKLIRSCQMILAGIFEDSSTASVNDYTYMCEEEVYGICSGQAMKAGHFINALCIFGMWPGSINDWKPKHLDYAIGVVREIGKAHANWNQLQCKDSCDACGLNWGWLIEDKLKAFEESLHGLCLTCLKGRPEVLDSDLMKKCGEHNKGFAVTGWFSRQTTAR